MQTDVIVIWKNNHTGIAHESNAGEKVVALKYLNMNRITT